MYRFVDLTESYYGGLKDAPPICAFLTTVTDTFFEAANGDCTFSSDSDIDDLHETFGQGTVDRCRSVVPKGFWDRKG